MNLNELPYKKSVLYTEHLGVRVEPALKLSLDSLNDYGIDAPEWIRICLRNAVKEQLRILKEPKTMSVDGLPNKQKK